MIYFKLIREKKNHEFFPVVLARLYVQYKNEVNFEIVCVVIKFMLKQETNLKPKLKKMENTFRQTSATSTATKNSTSQFVRGVKGDRTLKRAQARMIMEKLKENGFTTSKNQRSSSFSSDTSESASSKLPKFIQFILRFKTTQPTVIS